MRCLDPKVFCSLRDVTSENDHEQRRRIQEMEKDITSIDDLQGTPCYYSFVSCGH